MVVVGPLEVRQQGLEGGHRQAGQLLEDSGSKAELLEVQHTRAPRSRRKGIAYSKDDLIPIKSDDLEERHFQLGPGVPVRGAQHAAPVLGGQKRHRCEDRVWEVRTDEGNQGLQLWQELLGVYTNKHA